MKTSELEAKIPEWEREFTSLTGVELVIPVEFWRFVANRLSETESVIEECDIVRVRSCGEWRRVRLVGTVHGGLLRYESADGIGEGACFPNDVHKDDKHKMSQMLEELLENGSIPE